MRRRSDDLDHDKLYWWQLLAAFVVAIFVFGPLFSGGGC